MENGQRARGRELRPDFVNHRDAQDLSLNEASPVFKCKCPPLRADALPVTHISQLKPRPQACPQALSNGCFN